MKNIDTKTIFLIFVLLPVLIGVNAIETFATTKSDINVELFPSHTFIHPELIGKDVLTLPTITKKNYMIIARERDSNCTGSQFGVDYYIYQTDDEIINIEERNKSFYVSNSSMAIGDVYYLHTEKGIIQEKVNQYKNWINENWITHGQQVRIIYSTTSVFLRDKTYPPIEDNNGGGEVTKELMILSPKENGNVYGKDNGSLLNFDFKIQGTFDYVPDWFEFDNKIEELIKNSLVVRVGSNVVTGVKVTGFKWIESPKSLVKFELTGTANVPSKGDNQLLTIGCTIPQGTGTTLKNVSTKERLTRAEFYKYVFDEHNVNFKNDNNDANGDNVKPPPPGETDDGQVKPGDEIGGGILDPRPPVKPNNGDIFDWLGWIVDTLIWWICMPIRLIIDLFVLISDVLSKFLTTLTGMIDPVTKVFGFLPKEIINIITGSIAVMVLVSIVKWIRG